MSANKWAYSIGKTAAAIFFALFLTMNAYSQEDALAPEKKEPFGVMKDVTGTVSAIDKHCIAVVYKRDAAGGEYELPITINDTPEVERVESLSQIKMGDTVKVKYEQMTEIGADGKEIVGGKFAKTIIFLRPAPYQPEEEEDAEAPLDSGKE